MHELTYLTKQYLKGEGVTIAFAFQKLSPHNEFNYRDPPLLVLTAASGSEVSLVEWMKQA